MGFKLNRVYALSFQGDLEGLEVKMRATSVGVVEEVHEASSERRPGRIAELFADHLIEWNAEDSEGSPLPCTVEAIKEHMEEAVLAAIMLEWMRAAVGRTAPLDLRGVKEVEESLEIPMEALV